MIKMEDIFDDIEQQFNAEPPMEDIVRLLEENHWQHNPLPMDNRMQRIAHSIFVEGKTIEEIAPAHGVKKERIRQIKDKARTILTLLLRQAREATLETIAVYKAPGLLEEEHAKPEGELEKLLQTSVEELDLSVRALRCLRAAKIYTLGELAAFNTNDFLKFRNFGKKTLVECENLLHSLGLDFGGVILNKKFESSSGSFTLPMLYRLENFSWSAALQHAFEKHHIHTVADLLNSKTIFTESNDITSNDFHFLERRIHEWGLRW